MPSDGNHKMSHMIIMKEMESDDKNGILSKFIIKNFDPVAVMCQLTKYADTLSLTLEVVSLLYMFCHLVLLSDVLNDNSVNCRLSVI